MSIEQAQARLYNGLLNACPGINEKQADQISGEFFSGFMDIAVRLDKKDSPNLLKVADAGIEYARGLFELKNSGALEYQSDIMQLRKDVAGTTLYEANATLHASAFDAIDGLIQDSSTESTENFDTRDTKLKEAFEPVIMHLSEKPDDFQELFKLFDKLEGDKAVRFNTDDLDAVKTGLSEALADGDISKVSQFLDSINNAGVKFYLSQYMKTTVMPLIAAEHGAKVALQTDKSIQGQLRTGINIALGFEGLIPERSEAPNKEELSVIQEKRDYIADALIGLASDAQRYSAQIPNFKTEQFIAQGIADLDGRIREKFGEDVSLYKDDLILVADHLEATKDISQEEQKASLSSFLNDYGKFIAPIAVFMLGPVISGLSMIPILGKPLARLTAPLLNNVEKFAPVAVGLLAANAGKGAPREAAA